MSQVRANSITNAAGTGAPDLPNGLAVADGTAAAPSLTNTGDTNTGLFFPAADTVAVATGGVTRATVDGSGNVGIGTTSPAAQLQLAGNSNGTLRVDTAASGYLDLSMYTNGAFVATSASQPLRLGTNNTERARIDSSGNFFINSTSFPAVGTEKFGVQGGTTIAAAFITSSASEPTAFVANSTNGTVKLVRFSSGSLGNTTGEITANGTNTTYGTSSDYRLKENVQPMMGALDTIAQLNPVTYNWISNGSKGQGFIAHELQAVVPDCVVGGKDAVDADGKPEYQNIDTSFLVGILTKAIQEQQALITALTARVAALEAQP